MSKNNEIVAIKAGGTSLHRLAVPLFLAGAALAVTMFVLDYTYLPYANQRQDALHNQIKGRPPQTYTRPQRWIFGENYKIYNYDLFDPLQNLFGGLSVLEIDPANFQMRRRIFAKRGRWSESQHVWVLEGAGCVISRRLNRPLRAVYRRGSSGTNRTPSYFQSRGAPGVSDEPPRAGHLH